MQASREGSKALCLDQQLRPALIVHDPLVIAGHHLASSIPLADHRPRRRRSFPAQANGSLITQGRQGQWALPLIGQTFAAHPGYFHGRPSAAGTDGLRRGRFVGHPTSGPTRTTLDRRVSARTPRPIKARPRRRREPFPVDAVTTSASGLDPDIIARMPCESSRRRALPAARGRRRRAELRRARRRAMPKLAGRLALIGEKPRVNVLGAQPIALDRPGCP